MGVGYFLEKEHRPSRAEMECVMGARRELFRLLTGFLKKAYQLDGELTYGGKNYGWNVWYRRAGKSLVSLFPQEGHLVAQVVLGKEQAERASALALGVTVKKVFADARVFHDGRWLYIPVRTQRDARDVVELIKLKRKPDQEQRRKNAPRH